MMKVERKGRNWETGNRTFIHGGGLLCSPWFQLACMSPITYQQRDIPFMSVLGDKRRRGCV